MFGLGKSGRPEAVAFDVIGTLFPLDPLRPAVVALGLPPAGLEGWFAAGLRDAFALAAADDYRPLMDVLEPALDQALAEQGLDPPRAARRAVLEAMGSLLPREGAAEALGELDRAGLPILALTNGSASSTRSLLERAGLLGTVAHIVSIDDVKLSKPRREVYQHAARTAGVAPAALALVAAHPWDINGAAAAGLVTAYLSADRPFSPAMRSPDLTAETLPDLARQILAL